MEAQEHDDAVRPGSPRPPPAHYPARIDLWWPRLWFLERFWALYRWVGGEGLVPIFITVVVAAGLAAELFDRPRLWFVPAVAAGLGVVLWAAKTRRRIVIEDFTNETSAKDAPVGAATLLAIELARIRDLLRVVDERNTLRTAVGEQRPLDAAVKVDELTSVLGSSVTPDTKVTLGPITIPVGTVLMFVGRLTQGPRLRCHVHEVDDRLVVSAQLGGLRHSPVWRIDRELSSPSLAARAQALDEIVPELACRVFTNLGLKRKVKWRAMESFTEALRIYRSCLRTPRDRAVKLIRAQQHLVEALAHDEDFVLVYYNLGVVYSELSRLARRAEKEDVAERHEHAAEAAFRRAVEQDPTRWESYYALARIQFEQGERDAAADLCERVVRLSARAPRSAEVERAKAYDLIAHCDTRVTARTVANRAEASIGALRAVRRGYRNRVAGSEDDPLPTLNDLAANCLANLGVSDARYLQRVAPSPQKRRVFERRRAHRRVVTAFRLAQRLTTKDANLHFELGRIAMRWRDHGLAVSELTSAARVEPERALFWATLAAASFRAGDKESASDACKRAEGALNLRTPSDEDRKAIRYVTAIWRLLGDEGNRLADRLQLRVEFVRELDRIDQTLGSQDGQRLTKRTTRAEKEREHSEEDVGRLREDGRAWEAAHLAALLGSHYLDVHAKLERAGGVAEGYPTRAVRWFQEAISILKENDLGKEIVRHDLHARLARAFVAEKRRNAEALRDAQRHAQRAVSLNPLSSTALDALAHVYNGAGDLDRAKVAWGQALLLNPDNPMLHWELGYCCRRLAIEAGSLETRKSLLKEARTYLQNAADVFPYEAFEDRVRVHYWLARASEELGDHERVVASLRLLQTSPDLEIVAAFLIAQAYRRQRNFNEAEALYAHVIEQTGQSLGETVGTFQVDETWPYETLHNRAKCSLAISHADRHGDMHMAATLLDEVATKLPELERKEAPPEFRARVRELRAAWHHARGRVALDQADVDWRLAEKALEELEKSVQIRAHPEVYLDLAVASWRSAAYEEGDVRDLLLERAHRYCALVRATDARSLCRHQVEELVPKLEAAQIENRVARRRQRGEAQAGGEARREERAEAGVSGAPLRTAHELSRDMMAARRGSKIKTLTTSL